MGGLKRFFPKQAKNSAIVRLLAELAQILRQVLKRFLQSFAKSLKKNVQCKSSLNTTLFQRSKRRNQNSFASTEKLVLQYKASLITAKQEI